MIHQQQHRPGLYVHHRLGPKYFIQLSLLHPWLLHCGQCTATAELGVLLPTSSMPRHSASRSRSPILDTGLLDNDIWFVLVDGNAATCCSTGDKAVTQDPSTEENEENKVATQDPYMTIPRKTKTKKKKKKGPVERVARLGLARASDSPETINTIMETWRIFGAIYMASQRP